MASFPLVSATGMLGSGFRAESLDKAISLGARMIGCDAASERHCQIFSASMATGSTPDRCRRAAEAMVATAA